MPIQVIQVDPVPSLMPYEEEQASIRRLGGELIIGDCNSEADVVAQAQDAEIILLSWKPVVTPAVMAALPRLRFIIRWGVGYDMIDANAAAAQGIAVANAPTYCTEEVAEHAVALLFSSARCIPWFRERLQRGEWGRGMSKPIHRIAGRTLGIVGVGRIGSAVARRAAGLGLRVLAYDRFLNDDAVRARGAEPRAFDQLLAESDFVTVHVPLNADTRRLIDATVFAHMKPGAIFINTSRGPVVDEQALIAALATGHLAGAALDVFEQEPLAADSPLRSMEPVICTPHVAAYSEESWVALRHEVCDTVGEWIRAGWSPRVVNPEVRSSLRARVGPAPANSRRSR